MASITLTNHTKEIAKRGRTVIADPRDSNSFIYAPANATNILGIIAKDIGKNELGEIITSGEAYVCVAGMAVQGSIIRAQKSTDRLSSGECKIAKSIDAPYLRLGTTIESGRGLVKCILNPSYIFGDADVIDTDTLGAGFETVSKNLKSYPYVLTYGVDGIDTITYDLGGGLSIVKTFNYVLGVLTTMVLSGDTPTGISLTKTLSYTGADLTGVAYS